MVKKVLCENILYSFFTVMQSFYNIGNTILMTIRSIKLFPLFKINSFRYPCLHTSMIIKNIFQNIIEKYFYIFEI